MKKKYCLKVVVDLSVYFILSIRTNASFSCNTCSWAGSYMSVNQASYFNAGIFDLLNVACEPLQQLKTPVK